MSPGAAFGPVALAGLGGAALVLALRELLRARPAVGAWLEGTLLALIRAGREGSDPTELERRRLGLLAGVMLAGVAVLIAGPGPIAVIAAAGPALASWAVGRRRIRYRREVERELPALATAIADALSGGGSLRAALLDAARGSDGPAGAEMARLAADLEVGMPIRGALAALAERLGSPRIEALVAALLSQQRSGGDLAGLLRRHAAAAAEQEQAAAEARSATAQARLTGAMVVAMPVGVALLAELLVPGFLGSVLADPVAVVMIVAAVGLQLLGFAVIRRLGRVER